MTVNTSDSSKAVKVAFLLTHTGEELKSSHLITPVSDVVYEVHKEVLERDGFMLYDVFDAKEQGCNCTVFEYLRIADKDSVAMVRHAKKEIESYIDGYRQAYLKELAILDKFELVTHKITH